MKCAMLFQDGEVKILLSKLSQHGHILEVSTPLVISSRHSQWLKRGLYFSQGLFLQGCQRYFKDQEIVFSFRRETRLPSKSEGLKSCGLQLAVDYTIVVNLLAHLFWNQSSKLNTWLECLQLLQWGVWLARYILHWKVLFIQRNRKKRKAKTAPVVVICHPHIHQMHWLLQPTQSNAPFLYFSLSLRFGDIWE